ncbi:hypothetical protein JR316_0010954 [Psilocybe cubensis]|uniref:Uncharacterized protein n=1 Tax=Psilocybe cubensis TaxID=181762 RepID=A0ACB8GN12_PSICU|nr:hypothetical protein JR316_0010954 [Psilocybe cubensis]KAH9477038.1 hypothetical protein JR316_0010954 [Psilocybe cubensis]
MTKPAAKDFEDLLQCSIPVFEGLLPPAQDKILQDTLKLCPLYATKKLPKETAARARRAANNAKKGKPATASSGSLNAKVAKMLNLFTYKLHALRDYVKTIWMFGPTEGYSTQRGELEHHCVKHFFVRTNKGSKFEWQISRHERREHLLYSIAARVSKLENNNLKKAKSKAYKSQSSTPSSQKCPRASKTKSYVKPPYIISPTKSESLPPISPSEHYQMSTSRHHKLYLYQFMDKYSDDAAVIETTSSLAFLGILMEDKIMFIQMRTVPRFMDRDMFNLQPGYFGLYAANLDEELADNEANPNPPITAKQAAAMDNSESEDDDESEQEDQDKDNEGFVGEDGEEPWDVNDMEAVGFAEF